MPNPTRAQFHTDQTATDHSVAIMQDGSGFVADKFAPSVYTPDRTGQYVVYEDGDFNRDEMEERGPAQESAGGGYNLSRSPYEIKRFAYHIDTDYVESADADEVLDPEADAIDFVTTKALIRREANFATKLLTPGAPGDIWTHDVDGVAAGATADASFDTTDAANNDRLRWDLANSTPLWDMSKARLAIAKSGLRANTLLLTLDVFEALAIHPDILALISGASQPGNPAIATEADLGRIFHVERVLVMSGIKNAAKKGQTKSNAFIGGAAALLAHVAPNPGKRKASAAYTYTLRNPQVDGLSSLGTRVRRIEMDTKTAFRVEIEQYVDHVPVAPSLGCLFTSIVGS